VLSWRRAERGRWGVRLAAVVAALAAWGIADAQESYSDSPRGQISIDFQHSVAQDLHTTDFTIKSAPITARLVDFGIDYALNDRWTLTGGLPWIEKKVGTEAHSHDPLLVTPPHPESDFVDDGHFHGYLQDLSLGARYLALSEPFIVEPYVSLTIPVGDYPFFAIAAVGQHLRRTELGSTLAYRPPFLKWFFSLSAGYVYSEETLGQNIDATRVDGEAVFFVGPRVSVKTFFSSKNGKGLAPPRTPTSVPSDVWYHHDQMVRHNYATLGVGFDWKVNDRNVIGLSFINMIHTEDIFKLKNAFDITLSRPFGPALQASNRSRPQSHAPAASD
jgi:hypothetical protein